MKYLNNKQMLHSPLTIISHICFCTDERASMIALEKFMLEVINNLLTKCSTCVITFNLPCNNVFTCNVFGCSSTLKQDASMKHMTSVSSGVKGSR